MTRLNAHGEYFRSALMIASVPVLFGSIHLSFFLCSFAKPF